MKKLLNIFIAMALVMVIAVTSCSDKMVKPGEVPADCIMLNIFNSPMTKVQDWTGVEYERILKRLDCFFYPKGQTDDPCVYYQKVDVEEVGSAEIPFYVDESVIEEIFPSSNECDVFVIANLPSGTFAKGQTGTDVPTLSKTVLTLGGDRDAIDKPFIMQGLNIATKGDNNNASGTIPLHRATAKVTITVNIPEQIVIEYENANNNVTMEPVFRDNMDNITLRTAFHNGVKKTYLRDDYSKLLVADDAHHVGKQNYIAAGEVPAVGDTPKKYTFTCEIPFYTYARAWEKGAEDAAYLTFEMPWTNMTDPQNPVTQTYYYQILINGSGRCFEPNNWYDLTVNVGVIGSTVESEPVQIQDITYYVLDWTTEPDPEHEAGGDRYEDVEIEDYTYLQISEKHIVMNNTTTGYLPFTASHNIKWAVEWPDDDDVLTTLDPLEETYNTNKYHSYYINCRPSRGTTPVAASLANYITNANFVLDDAKRKIVFTYPKTNIANADLKVYSPVFVHLKVWLDIDGQGNTPNGIETKFVEYITFTYYPPIYIVPELSVTESVYVNGYQATDRGDDEISINNKYDLGGAYGQDDSKYMHTITVSSFSEDNYFTLNNSPMRYIIGDPRVRVSDTNLNDDNYNMSASSDKTKGWVKDKSGSGRILQNYYPTSTEGEVYRIISPKFRISSKLGGYSAGDREGVMMRCASYQENGYPAGRWRVPTTAEIAFIVYLQSQEVIQDLFVNNQYFSSTHMVTQDGSKEKISNIDNADHSVRCVYDEWYWGSAKEADRNTTQDDATKSDYYLFTWGDKKIW